jgi:hypothetical protein
MKTISYSRNRFPPDVSGIRSGSTSGSPPSYRDVEDALVERGLTPAMSRSVGTLKFRPMIARNFHEIRPKAFSRSRLDEVDGKSKCGAPSGSKAGFVRSWSNPNAIRLRCCGCAENCFDVSPSFRRLSSPTTENLWSDVSRNWLLGLVRTGTARQQSRGEFASATLPRRRKNARLQINQVGSVLRFQACGSLQ